MDKKNLLVSFSGGETSAYMANWLIKNKSSEFNMVFVFANTGQENNETLDFIQRCDEYFGLNVVWVEAVVNNEFGIGTTHKIVDYSSASRNGEVFESVISKFGIPNIKNPICTRELKERPIRSFAKSFFETDYFTAIGIRSDEIDRVSVDRIKKKHIYPLVEYTSVTKPMVNVFWRDMPFRLNLKGYQGNCKTCWKKSFRKLATIAKETPEKFDFFREMEAKYSRYIPEHKDIGDIVCSFFRGNLTVDDVFKISQEPKFMAATDDSIVYDYQMQFFNGINLDVSNGCSESCEVDL